MKSFMSWVGGKKALRDEILVRLPLYYERYVEVFGGAGWVLFHKPPGNDFEVFNDFNSNLATLFRCVRDQPNELIERLRFVLNSREDFLHIRALFNSGAEMSDLDRASRFFQLIRYSYASGLDSFASQPHDIWSDFAPILQASQRLRKVVIENKDCCKLIGQYDRPVSVFYCDPPYFATEGYYEDVGFTSDDHIRLRDMLLSIQGKFLLSYNDCAFIRLIYNLPGIFIEEVERLDNMAQRYSGGKMYKELLISNYDTSERKRHMPEQLQLFSFDGYPDVPIK